MKILEKLNEDYLNNVDFIYIYKHGAKVIKFDLRLWVFYLMMFILLKVSKEQ